MKKLTFILILVLCSWNLFGQGNKNNDSRWDLGIVFIPGISDNVHNSNYKRFKSNPYYIQYSRKNSSKISYSIGLSGGYYFTKKSAIQMQILFNDKGYKHLYYAATFGNKNLNHIYYIDIPISYKFKLKQYKNSSFLSTIGVAPSIYIFGDNSVVLYRRGLANDQAIVVFKNDNIPVTTSFYLSILYNFSIGKQSFEVGPIFNIALQKFNNKNKEIKSFFNGNKYEIIKPTYKFKPYFIGFKITYLIL